MAPDTAATEVDDALEVDVPFILLVSPLITTVLALPTVDADGADGNGVGIADVEATGRRTRPPGNY